jgi:deazaflavin-dependent oxidoreductase (nitroreductase family)
MARTDVRSELERADEIEITVVGRRTGRHITIPVWFVIRGQSMYLLPLRGSDTQWFKNLLKNRDITVTVGRARFTATVRIVRKPDRVAEVIELFRERYGAVEVRKYYTKMDVVVEVPLPH